MSLQRFRAFSFVDRIISGEAPGTVVGTFQLGGHLGPFPQALAAEAIGQLAAWQAMAMLDFQYRPVAALAGETRYHCKITAGELMSLAVNINSCDRDSISYSGEARSGDRLILKLNNCSGAMLPQEEFDDPELVAEEFHTLRSGGAQPCRLAEVPQVMPGEAELKSDGTIESVLVVPERADFFQDHFPRKPVLPATLLMQALSSMLVDGLDRAHSDDPTARLRLEAMRQVKVRSWIHPGDHVSLKAEGWDPALSVSKVKLSAHANGRRVASAVADVAAKPSPSRWAEPL
jgi:3-hydroxymyristoyl/3-hydroxydecanoyl-(acyl carrier protein) dehydratase